MHLRPKSAFQINRRSPTPLKVAGLSLLAGLLALELLTIGFVPSEAFAECKCPNKPNLKPAFDAASMVFVGRVEEQRQTPLKPGFTEVKVTVLTRFKDDEELRRDVLVFYTPDKAENCGYSFQPGFEYLIFASGNPAFYKSSACDRTEVIDNAQVDLHMLTKLTEKK